MTQEEIIQYNKRCAEFLGFKYHEGSEYWTTTLWGGAGFTLRQMKFYSDWNWIMEVVEAIEKLEYELTKALDEFRIESFQVVVRAWITPEHKIYNIIPCEPNTKKEAVVEAINQFLIWYEQQNK